MLLALFFCCYSYPYLKGEIIVDLIFELDKFEGDFNNFFILIFSFIDDPVVVAARSV